MNSKPPVAAARRLGAYYAASFLIVGIKAPFWPVWLTGRGMGPREIAALFAAAIWLNVVTAPAIGALADRLDRRRAAMIALAGVAILGYAGFWNASGFWALLGLTLVTATAQTALMPLGDSITLAAVRQDGLDYGRVRVWGSVSFIVAAMASGAVLAGAATVSQGGNAVLLLVLASACVLFFACIAVPAMSRETAGRPHLSLFGAMARDRRFWLFVVTAAALQASHQLYYGFGTLYWRSLGLSSTR